MLSLFPAPTAASGGATASNGLEFAPMLQNSASGQAVLGATGLLCGRAKTVSFGEMGKLLKKAAEFRLSSFGDRNF